MLQTLSYIINVAPDGVPQVVKLSQNENGRTLAFALTGVGTVNIPAGATVTISGTKPDGVVYSATGTLSGNVASFDEDTQMTAVSGIWPAKIKVTYNGETIATCKIVMAIDPDPVAPGSVPSSSQLNGLVAEAQQYATYAKEEAYGSPLVAATKSAMTNTSRVYVYTGSETGMTAGHWYYYNGSAWTDGGVYNSQGINTDTTLTLSGMAADSKVTGDQIAGLKNDLRDRGSGFNYSANANLYNINALVENKYIDPSTGEIVSTSYTGFAYSETYINVNPGETICSNNRMFIAYYNSDLSILSALQMDTSKKTVVPLGAVYARFSCSSVDHSTVIVQRGETLNNEKNNYVFSLDGLNVDPFSLGAQQNTSLLNIMLGKNLYNSHNLIDHKYIDPTTGIISTTSYAEFAYSPTYIPVTPGDSLVATDRMFIAYYDKNYNILSALQMDATKKTTVPNGAVFARFSVSSIDHKSVSVQVGTELDPNAGGYSFSLGGYSEDASNIIVDINGNGDYTSLTQAVYENVDNGKTIDVMPGTYDVKAEYISFFGQSIVDNLADATSGINNFQYGIRIHDRKIVFMPGAKVVCDWTGKTVNGTHRFCPFRVEPNARIVGLDLDFTATFYGIHDDYGTSDDSPFTVEYENCKIIGHNVYNANCIGGGAHKYSRHIIKNCYFKNNVVSSDRVLSADVRYHNTNTAGAEPELYVSNCYFSNNMNVTYYGSQTTKMKAFVNNCFAPYGIIKRAESASMNVDNVDLYTWNNQTE